MRKSIMSLQPVQSFSKTAVVQVNDQINGSAATGSVVPVNATPALLMETAQQLRIDLLFVPAGSHRHHAFAGNDGPDGVPAESQSTGNLPHAHAFLVEQEDCFTLVRFDHGVLSDFG